MFILYDHWPRSKCRLRVSNTFAQKTQSFAHYTRLRCNNVYYNNHIIRIERKIVNHNLLLRWRNKKYISYISLHGGSVYISSACTFFIFLKNTYETEREIVIIYNIHVYINSTPGKGFRSLLIQNKLASSACTEIMRNSKNNSKVFAVRLLFIFFYFFLTTIMCVLFF